MKTYHIFARKAYQEPLTFVTKLSVDDKNDLQKRVLHETGKTDWIEMIVVPEESIDYVVREGKIQ